MAHRIGGEPVSFHTPVAEQTPTRATATSTRLTPPGDRVEIPQSRLDASLLVDGAFQKSGFARVDSNGRLEVTPNANERSQMLDVLNSVRGALDDTPLLPSDYDALQRNMDALRAKQGQGFWNQLRSLLSPGYKNYQRQVDNAHSELSSAISSRKQAAEIMQKARARMENKGLAEQTILDAQDNRVARTQKRADNAQKRLQTLQTVVEEPVSVQRHPETKLLDRALKSETRADAAMTSLSSPATVSTLNEAMQSLQQLGAVLRRLRQAKLLAGKRDTDVSVVQKLDTQIASMQQKHDELAGAISKASRRR